MCTGPIAGLAVQLAAGLAVGYIAGTVGVVNYAGVLRAILVVFMV